MFARLWWKEARQTWPAWAFLAGVVMDSEWFDEEKMDLLRHHVLLVMMPVFFLSTGLRTNWAMGGSVVFVAATVLLVASIAGVDSPLLLLLGVYASLTDPSIAPD